MLLIYLMRTIIRANEFLFIFENLKNLFQMKLLNLLMCFVLLSSCANAQKEPSFDFKSGLLLEAYTDIKDFKQTDRTREKIVKLDESFYETLKFIDAKPKWDDKTKTRFNAPLLKMVDDVHSMCMNVKQNLSDYERILLLQTINEKIDNYLRRLEKFKKHSKS